MFLSLSIQIFNCMISFMRRKHISRLQIKKEMQFYSIKKILFSYIFSAAKQSFKDDLIELCRQKIDKRGKFLLTLGRIVWLFRILHLNISTQRHSIKNRKPKIKILRHPRVNNTGNDSVASFCCTKAKKT